MLRRWIETLCIGGWIMLTGCATSQLEASRQRPVVAVTLPYQPEAQPGRYILTPPAPQRPQINGARIFGML